MLAFLLGSATAGYLFHMVLQVALPAPHNASLDQIWYGALSAVHAVAIAWALSFRGQRVLLMFVLPVSATGLSVLRLLAAENVPEGLVSPFGAMAFAWLVAGSEPSPIRKVWLKWKLRRLKAKGSTRDSGPRLRVIPGGKHDDEEEEPPPGGWLN
jgi:hypothetical protein